MHVLNLKAEYMHKKITFFMTTLYRNKKHGIHLTC